MGVHAIARRRAAREIMADASTSQTFLFRKTWYYLQ